MERFRGELGNENSATTWQSNNKVFGWLYIGASVAGISGFFLLAIMGKVATENGPTDQPRERPVKVDNTHFSVLLLQFVCYVRSSHV